MTAATVPGAPAAVSKSAFDIDVRKVLTYGTYGAIGLVFIALSGIGPDDLACQPGK